MFTLQQLKEAFVDTPLLVYQVERSPFNVSIDTSNAFKTDLSYIKALDHIIIDKPCFKIDDCKLHITDAFSFFYDPIISNNNRKLIHVLPTERTLAFIKRRNNIPEETIYDIISAKKEIGYMTDIQKKLVQIIANSMGDIKANLKKISSFDDEAYTYVVFQELEYDPLILPDNFVPDVCDIGFFDIHILKSHIQYSLIKNKDFKQLVRNYIDRYSIKTCITFDNILYGHETFDEKKYDNIIMNMRNATSMSKINMYSQYATKEHFTNNIHGFYDAKEQTLELDNINIRPGVIVKISNQDREEENGYYKIIDNNILKKQDKPRIVPNATHEMCLENPLVPTKQICDSIKGTWDKPCQKNTECPFYQANKNYKNYRGGCIDGYCEMPLGVTRRGYHYFTNKNKALCHGCPLDDIHCCARQTNPDYKFTLDSFDRTPH